MVFWNLLSDIISNVVGRDLTIMWTKITQPQMTLLEMVLLETCSSLTSLSKYEIEKPNDPNIRPDICHFFSANVLLGSIFLHIKARKLWQNKFRDKTAWITDLATKRHELQYNPINCTHYLFFSCGDIWNFSTWQFFSTNNVSDISDKYQVLVKLV